MRPLAATMAGFSMIAVECDETRIDFRLKSRYLDKKAANLDEALLILEEAKSAGKAVSIGLLGNAVDIYQEILARGIKPDVVTDQTSAHDPLHGYLPQGWNIAKWKKEQDLDPDGVIKAAKESIPIFDTDPTYSRRKSLEGNALPRHI